MLLSVWRTRAIVIGLLAVMAATAAPVVRADEGDKPGWSFTSDPRKRAFLKYVAERDGPRLLLLACLRDADMFSVYSTGLSNSNAPDVTLSLANGGASYAVSGAVEPDGLSRQPTFTYETDADAKALQQVKAALMPVLAGKGPIAVKVGAAARDLPIAGLSGPLQRFNSICFGR
jgi:hypothetical protein